MKITFKGLNQSLGTGVLEIKEGDLIANVYFKILGNGKVIRSQVCIIHGTVGIQEFKVMVYNVDIPEIVKQLPEYKQCLTEMEEPDIVLYRRGK